MTSKDNQAKVWVHLTTFRHCCKQAVALDAEAEQRLTEGIELLQVKTIWEQTATAVHLSDIPFYR